MRNRPGLRPLAGSPRLVERIRPDRSELWTETVGELPPVYGERWTEFDGRRFRSFEPGRSKLAAGVVRGWEGDLPAPGERWLYLGAATGTTASHVADLVGPTGALYAVERSVRPFARLLALAERWPNLRPILADARDPAGYVGLVPIVDGVYADVAQADQLEIARRNIEWLGRGDGVRVILALKTASMGRHRSATGHRDAAESYLGEFMTLARSVALDPFHRGHFLVGGRWGTAAKLPAGAPRSPSRPRGLPRGRRER